VGVNVQVQKVPCNALLTLTNFYITYTIMVKVALLGAAGGIGQPLAMLLKINQHVTDLALYDIVATPGVAADLSHINTASKVGRTRPSGKLMLK
jgi:hypothetical protein